MADTPKEELEQLNEKMNEVLRRRLEEWGLVIFVRHGLPEPNE